MRIIGTYINPPESTKLSNDIDELIARLDNLKKQINAHHSTRDYYENEARKIHCLMSHLVESIDRGLYEQD